MMRHLLAVLQNCIALTLMQSGNVLESVSIICSHGIEPDNYICLRHAQSHQVYSIRALSCIMAGLKLSTVQIIKYGTHCSLCSHSAWVEYFHYAVQYKGPLQENIAATGIPCANVQDLSPQLYHVQCNLGLRSTSPVVDTWKRMCGRPALRCLMHVPEIMD